MVDAFATYEDLELLLNRQFTTEAEQDWITGLLESASTYLRSVADGNQIYPQSEATYTDYPDGGRCDLPQQPVVSVDAVQRDTADVDYTYRPGYITVDNDLPVDITLTYGYETPPAELTRLACVLVSSALLPLEASLGLTAGGLSSVAIDDFKLAWADAGASSGMVLPPIQEAAVRRQFGKGDASVVTTR
jgi:hypothetical protein